LARIIGEMLSMPIVRTRSAKALKAALEIGYGKARRMPEADDDRRSSNWPSNLRNGVPIATPVFDGARRRPTSTMLLEQAGLNVIRSGHAL
jgi:hypothetical protein